MIRSQRGPLAILAASAIVAAFLGQSGIPVALGGLALALAVWMIVRSHSERMLLVDYVERHSFPSDTIEDFATAETATPTVGEARKRTEAWRSGYVDAELAAHRRRSEAATRAAATRRARSREVGT